MVFHTTHLVCVVQRFVHMCLCHFGAKFALFGSSHFHPSLMLAVTRSVRCSDLGFLFFLISVHALTLPHAHFFCAQRAHCVLRTSSCVSTYLHGSRPKGAKKVICTCNVSLHLVFSRLMSHPSLLFPHGHCETTPDYDFTDDPRPHDLAVPSRPKTAGHAPLRTCIAKFGHLGQVRCKHNIFWLPCAPGDCEEIVLFRCTCVARAAREHDSAF